jgi:hypothetical protein
VLHHPDPLVAEGQCVPSRPLPLRLIVLSLAALVVIAGAGLLFLVAPAQSVKHYLMTSYQQNHVKEIRLALLAWSPNRTTFRVTSRFERDPDYGVYDDPVTWHQYSVEVALIRHGLRWLPAQGGLISGDRSYGFFRDWTDTDPAAERLRAPKPCT